MSEFEVLYLSSAPAPAAFSELKSALKPNAQSVSYGMAEASFKFHNLVADGLVSSGRASVTSVVGRSINSRFHEGQWWPARTESVNGRTVHHVSVPNFAGAKQLWTAGALAQSVRGWVRSTVGARRRVLIADGAYVTAIPGVLAAVAGTDVVKLGLFADIYAYMGKVRDASNRGGQGIRAVRSVTSRLYRRFDGFIVLAEPMNDVVNPQAKPSLLMEGIVDGGMRARSNTLGSKDKVPSVLYAGALRREYGLNDLIEGFGGLRSRDVRLEVFGGGDFSRNIAAAAERDARITFHGYQHLDSVLSAEESAWLLVNPRPANQDFTKYSFPSKLMEYMASGTPVLTTRLPSIPPEYLPYLYLIDQPGGDGMTRALQSALSRPLAELHDRGARAKTFVLATKSHHVQAERLLDFADSVATLT